VKVNPNKKIKIAHFFGDQYVGTTEGKVKDLVFFDENWKPLKKKKRKSK